MAVVFWGLSLTAILIWSLIPSYTAGWDVNVYRHAILSLRAGHDPYADAIAVQQAYQHNPRAYQPGVDIPYSYVYSPVTLPVLRLISELPLRLSGTVYWTIYLLCAALIVWAGMQFLDEKERPVFGLLAPVAIYFPGLLQRDVLFSGNVAFILYGLTLCAAIAGWRRGRWGWFYAAVLLAGCCKAPMLSLLVIPVLSARRQWLPAVATGVAGLGTFVLQPYLWPALFHNYMQAVELQFTYNRDFSSSPAGLVANALFFRLPYQKTSLVCYLSYAVVVAGVLVYFSRKYLAGRISLNQWAPLLLVGAILLDPRVMEYDLTPIALPMALLAWRTFARGRSLRATIVLMAIFFAVINTLAALPHSGLSNPPWKLTAGCTMVAVFAAGAWTLWRQLQDEGLPVQETASPVSKETDVEPEALLAVGR